MTKAKTILMVIIGLAIIIPSVPLAYLLLIYDNAREIADMVTEYYRKNPATKLF